MSQDLIKIIKEVTMRDNVDEALTLVLGRYILQRISECKAGIKRFEEKYNMPFEKYEERLGVDISLSHEHEMDYAMWGALLDELEELEKLLGKLKWKSENS
ncbi:MAG: hypothetical protein QW261_05525 [Candidatus Jordarchaeaceae archaeon]